MSNEKFRADFRKLLDAAGDRMDQVVRRTGLQLHASLVAMSPVDTGRFKGNWQLGINLANARTDSPPDPGGEGATARATAAIAPWSAGDVIFLTNSLPYARPLEYGHSGQAPNGMVRLTMQRFVDAVERAVREVNR